VTVTIADDRGREVAALPGTREAGINRVAWNMRHEGQSCLDEVCLMEAGSRVWP
jgi:hypothetical protein